MSDVWDGQKWLVYGPWEGGKHSGGVCDRGRAFEVFFNAASPRIYKRFSSRDHGDCRATAREAADTFRAETSVRLGLTKNMYRHVWSPDTGDDWLEVKLTKGKTMLCDTEQLVLVEGYTWCAYTASNTFYATTTINNDRQTMIDFHRMVVGFDKIDHRNLNGLDNRRENLFDTTTVLNGRNHRLPKNNTSGICGVRFEETNKRWIAGWVEDDGTEIKKHYTLADYGEQAAFELALRARQDAELRLGITIGTEDYMEIDS
jgi:hypothetical protein